MRADEFLTLAKCLPEGMMLVSPDGGLLAINAAASRRLGLPTGQAGRDILSKRTGLSKTELMSRLKPCTRSRSPIPLALNSAPGKSGNFPDCYGFLATPAQLGEPAQLIIRLGGKSTSATAFVALNKEIEKQRGVLQKLELSREELRRSQEHLAVTLNSIGDAVLVTDDKGMVTTLNPVAEALLGWSEDEARGHAVKQVFPIIDASTRKPIRNPVEIVLSTGETVYLSNHTTLISKGGTEFQIADSAAPIRKNRDGDILGMVLVFHDVTEQYQLREENARARKELERSESLYRDLVETTAAVAWEFDLLSGKFVYMGPGILQLTGFPVREWISFDDWADRIHPADRQNTVGYCKLETAKGNDHSIEYRSVKADGTTIWIRDEISIIVNNNVPVTMRGFFFDITQSRETEEALRRAQKMDAVGQMAGGIAHDFNNILGIILGNVDLLEDHITDDPEAVEYIGGIKSSSERAATLTKQLLGFSRRQARGAEETNLNNVIKDMDSLITRTVTPQIAVDYDYEDSLWQVDVNKGDFQDALLNLVLNAKDAMDGHGELRIRTQNKRLGDDNSGLNPAVIAGEFIEVSVSDNGSGIDKKQQSRIFEPFFTTKDQGKGTGLGLSMVFGFVTRSRGHIEVKSDPGAGATFKLYLPRSKIEHQLGDTRMNSPRTLQTGEGTILVVDDEPQLLRLAEVSLSALGYVVLTANNGADALQRLEQSPNVDLLFSDIVMPGDLNGYELAEQAASRHPNLKILLTSGYSDTTVAVTSQKRFAENLISKPYSQAELSRKIRDQLLAT